MAHEWTVRNDRDVLDSHLDLAREGAVEEDLERNYSPAVVVLAADGVHRGHDGVRGLARRLLGELPGARFEYTTCLIEDGFAFLEWRASAEGARVEDGADSFLIRDGKIVAQTIHYTVR